MVQARINPLPVLCTKSDCNEPEPPEEEAIEIEVEEEGVDSCCGLLFLGGAHNCNDGDDRDLKPREKDGFKLAVENSLTENFRKGLVMYSLVDSQVVEAEGLRELGFQEMSIFRNPGTGNRVTLYGKLLNQPREKPVVAKKKAATKKVRR